VTELLTDEAAIDRAGTDAITALTQAATAATFYGAPLSEEQIAANKRIVTISAATCAAAATNANQHLAAAFVDDRFAGYVIATRHDSSGHELDWLMVHPDFHGSPVSSTLMQAGMDWLGHDKPMWLNVIAFNARAIRFYEKFGFAIDPTAESRHVVPHRIMRRA